MINFFCCKKSKPSPPESDKTPSDVINMTDKKALEKHEAMKKDIQSDLRRAHLLTNNPSHSTEEKKDSPATAIQNP